MSNGKECTAESSVEVAQIASVALGHSRDMLRCKLRS